MQNSQLPLKWYKPFAADDAAKVEIPVTTANPLRASQSLGFPPLTMQPPESGGVPPEGEDFNGAMNQVARVAWWMLAGGALPFDAAWAADANIVGYPQGASVTSADLQGDWISTADNNTNNPDTNGAGWVPGYNYGSTSLTGLTNANVTLTPAQAAKPILRLAGTLTGNIQIILPTWLSEWLIVNNTTGAFSVTCKTAAGAGVVISQAGGAQVVWGDGTNINALAGNASVPLLVGPATLAAQAVNFGQFGSNVVPAGYQKLPSGLIIQWGVTNTSASVDTTVTYPLVFPTAAYSVVGTVGAGTSAVMFTTTGTTTSSFIANAISSGGRNALACSWLALGK